MRLAKRIWSHVFNDVLSLANGCIQAEQAKLRSSYISGVLCGDLIAESLMPASPVLIVNGLSTGLKAAIGDSVS